MRALGVLHLLGLLGFAALMFSEGDDSTCAPVSERSDGPPCEACGQAVAW